MIGKVALALGAAAAGGLAVWGWYRFVEMATQLETLRAGGVVVARMDERGEISYVQYPRGTQVRAT